MTDTASGQARITSYTYCEAADVVAAGSCPVEGLLKSVDGPRTDVADAVTYAYYSADDAGCATGGACSYRKGDLRSVKIDPSLFKEDDVEILEDLIVAAHKDAKDKGETQAQEKMAALTAGIPLPPGMKFPF